MTKVFVYPETCYRQVFCTFCVKSVVYSFIHCLQKYAGVEGFHFESFVFAQKLHLLSYALLCLFYSTFFCLLPWMNLVPHEEQYEDFGSCFLKGLGK